MHRRDGGNHTVNLLNGRDKLPRAGLHPADVDDARPLFNDGGHAFQCLGVLEGGSLVIEGIRGAVDDGHDHREVTGKGGETHMTNVAIASCAGVPRPAPRVHPR